MNKTPVSILQEMMVKRQMIPNYELIHNGGGTHINTFTYQVTCDGLCATGTGRCKKDAKHEAAKAMLETIAAHRQYPQLPASPAQSPVRTPLPPVIPASPRASQNVPFVNAIGELQDLCCDNSLEEPKYCLISDVGPPHARVFTMQCIVATFKEEGVATTKKQAKHDAARKMLHRIKDLVGDSKWKDSDISSTQCEESRRKEIFANEIAKARYPMLSRLPSTKKVNLGLKLSEYHVKFKTSVEEGARKELIEKLCSLETQHASNNYEELTSQILSELGEILLPLNLDVSDKVLNSDTNDVHIVSMEVNSCPTFVEISVDVTLAKAKYVALLKLINTMILFLK